MKNVKRDLARLQDLAFRSERTPKEAQILEPAGILLKIGPLAPPHLDRRYQPTTLAGKSDAVRQ